MKMIAALLLAVAFPASAEFVVVEETETMTVYRDGNQIVVLIDGDSRTDFRVVWLERSPERAVPKQFRSQISGADRIYRYYVRTRALDGAAVCEKFAARPPDKDARELMLQIVALGPCG